MNQKAFIQDVTECTGCRCCQMACKDKSDLPVGIFYRRVHDFEGGTFPSVWAASLSLGCNHCADPQCSKNCPVAAYRKDAETGLVIQDTEMCIGCQKCTLSCPYGAPVYDKESDTVRKCNGCIDWLDWGMQPACVGACSTRALLFGDVEELRKDHSNQVLTSDIRGLPSSDISHPNTLVIPKKEMRETDDLER